MSLASVGKLVGAACLAALIAVAISQVSWSQQPGGHCAPCAKYSCGPGVQTHHCPPAYRHYYEGPPQIHWKRACPHPVANPCELPGWGYVETCWTPFPFQTDWSHCSMVPPAAYVNLPYPNYVPVAPRPSTLPALPALPNLPGTRPEQLPAPRVPDRPL